MQHPDARGKSQARRMLASKPSGRPAMLAKVQREPESDRGLMLYEMFQAQDDLAGPARAMARLTAGWLGHAPQWVQASYAARHWNAGLEVFAGSAVTHSRPPFGIDTVIAGNREVAVRERVVHSLPFGDLLRFEKDVDVEQPRVLVVAPLSGHFATLLRGTVQTMLPEHDVYITDWRNARDVPLSAGVVRAG